MSNELHDLPGEEANALPPCADSLTFRTPSVTLATVKPPRDLRTQLPTELPMVEGLSVLLRKCRDACFYCRHAELHRIALRTNRGLRANPDGLSFNLCGVLKQRVFHLSDGYDKGVAADGAPKGVTGRTGRHRGPKMNRRKHSTDSEGGCEEFRVNDSVRQSNLALRSAVESALRNACECNLLRFLKNGTARREARLAYFHRWAARYINGKKLPLGCSSPPNVGRVATTGSGQRHAMERLWRLFFCHSTHHRYSQLESAIQRVAAQVGGTEVVSLERNV
ncbi:hypothetical protein [Stenotrophomonas rhizophila]|uniref:hypothetical protein n=1 Tax=Stenotrophomonas rhizophila TaxID=216778 RepID=UPI003AF6C894